MIQEIIDDVLKPKERQRSGKISPSKLGQCYRRQYWDRLNETPSEPPDARTQRVFKAGDLFHDFIQTNLLTRYPTWTKEVKVEVDDILGFADVVSEDEVIDIKSQHSKSFWWKQKEIEAGKDIRDLFYPNWLQVMTYAWKLNKPKGRLVFVSKDDLCIQEFCLELDEKNMFWKGEIDMELTKIRYYWDNKTTPPAQPRLYPDKDGGSKECQWCQFKTKCAEKEKC